MTADEVAVYFEQWGQLYHSAGASANLFDNDFDRTGVSPSEAWFFAKISRRKDAFLFYRTVSQKPFFAACVGAIHLQVNDL